MNYIIREIKEEEYPILSDFLYEAIFIPEGTPVLPKEIINQPELQVYVKDFGKNKGDLCLVAEANNEIVGAVWCRIMNDYGHIDAETPSFAISLYVTGLYDGFVTLFMLLSAEALIRAQSVTAAALVSSFFLIIFSP